MWTLHTDSGNNVYGEQTAKELDKETGLYYYGARYLDPKCSRWISTDPALGEYIPNAPTDEEAKRHNQNLPGMGGVFNTVNASLYHYAGNNPVKYTDPDGRMFPAVTAAAYWASAFVVSAAVVCLVTPTGQQGLQTLGEAISYGAQTANQAVTNAVTAVKTAVKEKQESKLYMTYTMTNDKGVVYSGRTSGYGTPSEILEKRQKNHHMSSRGFSGLSIDKIAYGNSGKFAIRGREQQLIDKHGGAKSDSGNSGNAIRGVSKINPNGFTYHEASNKAFGNIAPYTGYKIIQGD